MPQEQSNLVSEPQLRPARSNDGEKIHQLFCIPKVYKFLADGQEPPLEVALEWINTADSDRENRGGGLWLLVNANDAFIGGLVRLSADSEEGLELAYLLHPGLWGKGFATRMAHSAMQYAFAANKVEIIWAGADVPNTASIEVMQRLGMQFRREVQYPLGPGVEYEMLKEDFDPDRIDSLPMS